MGKRNSSQQKNPLYSLDSDDRTWGHIYCTGDNGELSKKKFKLLL